MLRGAVVRLCVSRCTSPTVTRTTHRRRYSAGKSTPSTCSRFSATPTVPSTRWSTASPTTSSGSRSPTSSAVASSRRRVAAALCRDATTLCRHTDSRHSADRLGAWWPLCLVGRTSSSRPRPTPPLLPPLPTFLGHCIFLSRPNTASRAIRFCSSQSRPFPRDQDHKVQTKKAYSLVTGTL